MYSSNPFIRKQQKDDAIDKILTKNGYNINNVPHIKEHLCYKLINDLCVAKNFNINRNKNI